MPNAAEIGFNLRSQWQNWGRLALLMATSALTGCSLLPRPSLAPYSQIAAGPPRTATDLDVRFLGTSSLSFNDGERAILIDGFFTRPRAATLLLSTVRSRDDRIKVALQRAGLREVSMILVAHSHFDHAMDAPRVAALTGASVFGSASTANIARGGGLPEQRIGILGDGDTLSRGQFFITVFKTPHSPNALFGDAIDRPLAQPAWPADYQMGGNFSFLIKHGTTSVLVVPSANFEPGRFRDVRADVAFLSIGTLGKQRCDFIRQFWHETVQATGARLVIPIHWDDFTLPLSEPLVPLPNGPDNFRRGMNSILNLAQKDGIAVRLPKAFSRVDLGEREVIAPRTSGSGCAADELRDGG